MSQLSNINSSKTDINIKAFTNALLTKAFSLLGAAVLAACLVCYIGVTQGLFFGTTYSLIAVIGAMILSFAASSVGDTPVGYGLVVLTGVALGVAVTPMVYVYGTYSGFSLVINALLTTAAIFISLSTYAILSKRDFTNIGGFLVGAMLAAFVVSLLNVLFLKSAWVDLGLAYVVALVSCGLILFRISFAVRNGTVSAVELATGLLIDVYNLFISILRIFGNRN